MPDRGRFPTVEEFWRRLDAREVEPDLRDALRNRAARSGGRTSRVGRHEMVAAVAARIVPGDVPPDVLAVFLDEMFDKQLGRGDDRAGVMPREELFPTGFALLETEAQERHGRAFEDLAPEQQDELLAAAERGEIHGPARFDPAQWFKRVQQFLLLGFGSDPRGMVEMGFPGPSYRPGHIWLDEEEVAARAGRKRGYLEL